MTRQQPAGWARRALLADDGADHQIRLTLGSGGALILSCNCRRTLHDNGQNTIYAPLATFPAGTDHQPILAAYRHHTEQAAA